MTPLRVMVVEDEAVIAMLFSEVLENLGYEVCCVETTQADAVAAAARCKPDLMIVDERLSDGSGVAAVEEINRTGFIPHVFVSGDSVALQKMPNAIRVEKPFRESDLTHAIERAMAVTATITGV
jgi:CheY-like chemotaxis protein